MAGPVWSPAEVRHMKGFIAEMKHRFPDGPPSGKSKEFWDRIRASRRSRMPER